MENKIKDIQIKSAGLHRRFWEWVSRFFQEEYELTVWFQGTTTIAADGVTTISRSQKIFILKEISKKTQNHIVGKDAFGKPFEIKTVEPFDYQIRKVL
jgi:hypothetical protein